jgi:hypothetical protein
MSANIAEELRNLAANYENPVQKIAHLAAIEIEKLSTRIGELENGHYHKLVHNICTGMNIAPGDIETRVSGLDAAINDMREKLTQENAHLLSQVLFLTAQLTSQRKLSQKCNTASYSLSTSLCAIETVSEKDGFDLIRRDSVMDFVVRWRQSMNEASRVAEAEEVNALK